jgi:shikimate dehydrogenase
MGIGFQLVSRHFSPETLDYESITADVLQSYQLIVNTTPLGMMPDLNTCPPIPYEHATDRHYFYDLVYNPSKTRFLELAEKAGSHIGNGLSMLHLQAERAWAIWNGLVDEEPKNHVNH